MENWDELLEVMRRLVKEEPETAAQVLARLVTKFEALPGGASPRERARTGGAMGSNGQRVGRAATGNALKRVRRSMSAGLIVMHPKQHGNHRRRSKDART